MKLLPYAKQDEIPHKVDNWSMAQLRCEKTDTVPYPWTHVLVLAAIVFGFGVLALTKGLSNCWDLHNYHLYNGWAFWTDRGDKDFAAAQVQSYFNPLLATASYLLLTHTPVWLSVLLLGLIQGANIVPLYVLARRLLPASVQTQGAWFAFAIAVVGAAGATQLRDLGGTMGDNIVSLPLLCAFAVAFGKSPTHMRDAALTGLLAGITTGIKLTMAPFALGLVLASPLSAAGGAARWRIPFVAGLAAMAGFLATDGFWMLHLYREFGNPVHPMFAEFFGGEYAPLVTMRDMNYLPRTPLQWLFYPLTWIREPQHVSELRFFDLRVPLAFLAIPILLWRGGDSTQRVRVRALALALGMAYLAWLSLFGVYRYLAPLEMLAPLFAVLAVTVFVKSNMPLIGGALLALVVITTRPADEARYPVTSHKFLQIEIPALAHLDKATIVLAEDEPLAFLALGFPPTANFVRIGGNLLGPPYPEYGMDREAARRLAAAEGPLYALLANPQADRVHDALVRQQLKFGVQCQPVHSNLLANGEQIQLCPLLRAETHG